MKFKALSVVIVFILVFTFFATSALAWIAFGNKMQGGAAGRKFFIDSSADEYDESISIGAGYWNGRTSLVSLSETSTQSQSRFDCYWGNYYSDPGVIAATEFYLNNQITDPMDNDWFWCKIKFDSTNYKYEDEGGLSYFHRKGTSCHEFGHALGLMHNNITPTSVMCQLGYGRTVNSPSTDDVNGVVHIYTYY